MSELRLKTHLLDELRDYYAHTLEFPLIEEEEDTYIVLDAGATRLIFEAADEDDHREYVYHFAFNIPANQFTDAKMWLAQRTPLLEFDGRDEIDWTAWEAKAVYFKDPAGNIGELIARSRLDNTSSIPFSGQSIQRVSEIGLAVKDVATAATQLQEALGLPVFDEGGEMFRALGDDSGLFIIVKEGRPWFPTQDAEAHVIPVTLTLRGDSSEKYQLPHHSYVIYRVDE